MSERTLFVKLNESEALQIKALSREFGLAMEEILRRMILHALSELEAEKEVEAWRPEF
ncbi:hypothetical protein [Methylococcus capsulatus]|uniref:hypothetical protein n=1 Tax=Methylococcus capsulatus TaxID=414 RepID=UPI001C529758|nr:hypothetical protein [Methylococcus capsulatus]QXP94374.1 hypothetical protein KW113_04015 [Methylococcus capsulatus]